MYIILYNNVSYSFFKTLNNQCSHIHSISNKDTRLVFTDSSTLTININL